MDYLAVHNKWRHYWESNGTNKFNPDSQKPKYYCLEMLPYPSGATLHMGHFYMYGLPDVHARFKRMCGFEVFQPMGYDAFGLPAENHALKTGTHPHDNTLENMEIMTRQYQEMGAMYDWAYSYATCFPDYYKWTQWLFLQLYNAGLAYQKEAPVNWCDKCKTVLANEQVLGGNCERCDTEVIRRNMKQWFFKITDYAEQLLAGLDSLDWPNKTKVMQRNWIGKSVGSNVLFRVDNTARTLPDIPHSPLEIKIAPCINVFTTRIDTLFGVTYLAIAPEHPLTDSLITKTHKKACMDYIDSASKKSDIERLGGDSEKTGVFTGSFAINPINDKRIPICIADYVLASYGTGAVMGVPAHDERDWVFAKKYNLPIEAVIFNNEKIKDSGKWKVNKPKEAFTGDGILINSGKFNKLTSEEARVKITAALAKHGEAEFQTTYRLRDWGIGRQRYWGAPIPIIYCDKCGIVPVPEKDLPVVLPYIQDFKPKGAAPLANQPDFMNCKCPKCGIPAKRECDTMDTFVCSSWYFLRYQYAKRDDIPFDKNVMRADKYIGGPEHACGHLIYSRFINRFLHDKGLVPFAEPFPSLIHQGLILASDGQKMSKSKNNFIVPDDYVSKYGSDILRLFLQFSFNFIDGGPWNEDTLKTVTRFTERVEATIGKAVASQEQDKEVLHVQARTIKSVRADLEGFSFNTAVARCMEFLNAIISANTITKETVKTLVLLLAPMVPHIAEEYWDILGERKGKPAGYSIFNEDYPVADEKYLQRDEIEIAVQINSKIVARIITTNNAPQADVEKACADILAGKTVKKVVYIANRLVNFIV